MKFAKRFLAAACLVLCLASAGWCAAKPKKASAPSGGFPAILQRGSGSNLLGHDALRTGTIFKNFSDICRIDAIIPNVTKEIHSSVGIYTFTGANFEPNTPWMEARRLMRFISSGNAPTDIQYEDIIKKQMPTSLRSKKEWENKQLSYDDCLKLCEPYAPLVISARCSVKGKVVEEIFPVELSFFYPGQGKGVYLMQYGMDMGSFPLPIGTGDKERALYILETFGDREGIQDFYEIKEDWKYLWKDPNRKYAILLAGDWVRVFFIVDEETIFPVNGNTYFSYDEARKLYNMEIEIARKNGRKFNMSFEEYCERMMPGFVGMGFKKVAH